MSDMSPKKREISSDDDDSPAAGGRQNSKRIKTDPTNADEDSDDGSIQTAMDNQRIAKTLKVDMESDKDAAENALREIADLCRGAAGVDHMHGAFSNRKYFCVIGGPAVVLKAMMKHHESPGVQVQGCRVLCNALASLHAGAEIPFAALGGHDTVCFALIHFSTAADVQGMGCAVLANACNFPSLVGSFAGYPGRIGLVVGAMRRFPNDAKVQQYGCLALSRISSYKLAAYNKNIEDEGGLVVLVEAKTNHPNNDLIQNEVRAALKNMLDL